MTGAWHSSMQPSLRLAPTIQRIPNAWLRLLVVACGLAACSRDSVDGQATAMETASATNPPVSSSAPLTIAPPVQRVPLALVARGEGHVDLMSASGMLLVGAGRQLYRADEDGIHQEPEMQRGIPRVFLSFALWDGSPAALLDGEADGDDLYSPLHEDAHHSVGRLVRNDLGEEESMWYPHRYFKRSSDRWVETPGAVRGDERIVSVFEGAHGGRIGVVRSPSTGEWRFGSFGGQTAPLPSPTRAAEPDAEQQVWVTHGPREARIVSVKCKSRMAAPHSATGFTSGHIFVAGRDCSPGGGRGIVEWWSPRARSSQVALLEEEVANGTWSLAGASSFDVWALRRDDRSPWAMRRDVRSVPLLMHFDGETWSRVPLPDDSQPSSNMRAAADGSLWVGFGNHAKRRRGDQWEDIRLPPLPDAKNPIVRNIVLHGDDVWMVVESDALAYVLGPRAPAAVVELPSLAATGVKSMWPATSGYEAPTSACSSILVLLQAPAGARQRFPAVEAALSGLSGIDQATFVIDAAPFGPTLAAKVPSLALAEAMAERMRKHDPQAAPGPYCRSPTVTGVVTLALAATEKQPDNVEPGDGGRAFDRGAAVAALGSASARAKGCKQAVGPTGSTRVQVTFAPDGRATTVDVGPPFAGTAVGKCIAEAFKAASVPAFSGGPIIVSKSVSTD